MTCFRYILLFAVLMGILHAHAQETNKQGDWFEVATLNLARHGASAISYQDKIYIFGGNSESGETLKSVEVYSPIENSWDTTAIPTFKTPRVNASATLFEDEFYLIGGRDSTGNVLNSIEIYNPVSDNWRTSNMLASIREGHVASVISGSLFIFAGIGSNEDYLNSIEYLQTGGGFWQVSSGVVASPRAAPFSATIGNTTFVMGGIFVLPIRSGFSAITSADSLLFSPLPQLLGSRGNGATAVVGDSIFMMGGVTTSGPSDRVEIYNKTSGEIEEGTALTSGRIGASGATIMGRPYIIGGYSADPLQPLNRVEVFQSIKTGIEDRTEIIEGFSLLRAYPNPFNGQATLEINLQRRQKATLKIFDVAGRLVTTLANEVFPAGKSTVLWNTSSDNSENPSGLYFAVFKGDFSSAITRLIYVK
ncbi:MAG: kelch repeat-containing protein [Calditrichia bacterium]